MASTNERQQKFSNEKRKAGYVKIQKWVHIDDKKRVITYIDRINNQRGKL